MDYDIPAEATIDFVPAICFVPRGVAKEKPDKVTLSPEELKRIIEDTKSNLKANDGSESNSDDDDDDNVDDDGDISTQDTDSMSIENGESNASGDAFGFDNYEEENEGRSADIADVVEQQVSDAEDSEIEDDIIKSTDNLLLVGHVQDDAAYVEVWVFNQLEESLYTHHEFLLPNLPLCLEWLYHDPGNNKNGNMVAIGCLDPIITVWDLDIEEPLEPVLKLGSKGKRRQQQPAYGHKDAVLDICWNRQYEHILASGSVDQSVILWDLDSGQPHTTITAFKEKVQSIQFNPALPQTLLCGSSDCYAHLFDCRDPDAIHTTLTKWKVNGEVEKVLWNPSDTNYFVIGDSHGYLHYADARKPKNLLWSYQAHEEEISGICFNTEIKNLLTTVSTDGCMKIWDFNSVEINPVYTHNFHMGRLQCLQQCPEDPFTLAFGGEKAPRCRVYNIKNFSDVRRVFNLNEILE